MSSSNANPGKSQVVRLSIGGCKFLTTNTTLCCRGENFFTALLSGKFQSEKLEDGSFFVDRDGTYFRYILNFLRDGVLPTYLSESDKQSLLMEAQFYQIQDLVDKLDPSESLLEELISDISGETLKLDYEQWVNHRNEEQCQSLGESLPKAVELILEHLRTVVKTGNTEGQTALLLSDMMPAEMSFLTRGKVDVVTSDGAMRELPLKYHDWAGRHPKVDFVALQKKGWQEVCNRAVIDPCMKIFDDAATTEVASYQLCRILKARKIEAKVAIQCWLNLTTPLYSQEGVRGDCPVVASFCMAPFLAWSL